jgi:polyisoprenyl-teichoic acid--peptidoglycan teichoic acid transferase
MTHPRQTTHFHTARKPEHEQFPILVPIAGFIFGLTVVFFATLLGRINSPSPASPLGQAVGLFAKPTPTPTPDPRSVSVLLLGYGGGSHEGGYLTDTIMQVVIRPIDKTILLISIPRDLFVTIPLSDTTTEQEKINAAFVVGMDDQTYPDKPQKYKSTTNPGALPKDIVSQVTGIPINAYVALSFNGFVKAIDALGGIDVNFPSSFDDYKYPITEKEEDTCGRSQEEIATLSAALKGDDLESQFPCRYEHLHVDHGLQHIDGEFALKIARSRHSTTGDGDFGRAQRQRLILQAVKERIFTVNFIPKAIPFFLTLGKDLKTDVDVSTIQALIPFAQEFRSYKIKSIALTDQNVLTAGMSEIGAFILEPTEGMFNWDQTKAFIAQESTRSAEIIPSVTPRF